MLHYHISYQWPTLHWLNLELSVSEVTSDTTFLQLPAWRPGRYELGNFAKNVRRFQVVDHHGQELTHRKVTKDRWEVDTSYVDSFRVIYEYYAGELNAGSTWLDEEQLYINFVNCTLYVEGRQDEPYQVSLDIPNEYKIACGLPQTKRNVLEALTFYHLAESPMMASAHLLHWQYEVQGHQFHLWFQGECLLDPTPTLEKFRAFTQEQINTMRGFPSDDYHFLFQFLPYRAYHGVEHYNSTVIALGPASQITEKSSLHYEFLGVSSHELFHTWNIIRIRPQEMTPYDYARENYFPTGFIAEGVTTYYGDLFLVRSGVFTKEDYFLELNKLFKRHFDNFGRFNHSLVESSYDLWLDGYTPGIPDRKVSIYVKGALVSLLLDLELRLVTEGEHSLDTFVQYLWDFFGKKKRGYSIPDLQKLVGDLSGNQISDYFDRFIYGKEPLEKRLSELLQTVGCELVRQDSAFPTERYYGFRVGAGDHHQVVQKIVPDSPAAHSLSINDRILSVNGVAPPDDSLESLFASGSPLEIIILRQQRVKTATLTPGNDRYLPVYTLEQRSNATFREQENFEKWLGCRW